ncbi:MAG: hypothetical protein HKO93_07655, partial [Flavobacteriales bacterium]|nr:hypothetical protein [Flavobacteriales bacterium]
MIKYLLKAFVLTVVLSCTSMVTNGASGIFQTYIVLDVNGGGDEFFAGGEDADMIHAPFDGVTYGQVSSLVLNGGEVKTFSNLGSIVLGAELYYNIHLVSEPAGAFIPLNLPFESILPPPAALGDQRWQQLGSGIDVMDGLSPGTYELEVFWKATSTDGDHFDSNGGLNYSATFVIPEANENCSNAIPITPSVLGVAAWETFSLGEVSSEAGCIGNADDDIWFSFVAQSPNDIVVAQDPSGTYDAVVEIYSDCGTRIDCYDNYGPGEVERALAAGTPGDEFEVGSTYYFRVYNKATGVTGSPDIRVMVKTFEEGGLKSKYCNVFDYELNDQIWSFNDAAGQLYS